MRASKGVTGEPKGRGPRLLWTLSPLAVLCLCVLALRVTYTEAPTVQTTTVAGSLMDTIYSLTLSGLLIFGCIGWLVYRFVASRSAYRVTGMEIGQALFVVAAIVSSVAASDKRTAISHAAILLAPPFAALALAQILNSRDKVRLVLFVVVTLGIVSAYQCAEQLFLSNAITIEQYESDPNALLAPLGIEPGTFQHFLFEHRLYSRGIRGFFTTSNSAASFGICASFAAIALLLDALRSIRDAQERRRRVLFAVVASAVVIAGLLLTQSKGGIMACVAGLAVVGLLVAMDWRFSACRRRILAILVPAAVLVVVAVACVAVHYGLRHGRLPGGNSMLVRWQYWVASAQMCADHPFTGVGPGNFSDHYPHYKPAAALESVADPHNWPLSLIAQYGPLGLTAFIAMLCGPLWRSLRAAAVPAAKDAASCQTVSRGAIHRLLAALGLCLLLIRPLLIPTSGAGGFDVWLYEVFTLFVTPAAVFLIGFLLVAGSFGRTEAVPASAADSTLSASLVAAIVAVLLHNLIDFAIFEPGVWTAFWITLACLVGLHTHQEPRSHVLPWRPQRVRHVATVGAVLLFGLYVLGVWMPAYRTTMGIAKAQQAIASGRLDLAHRVLDETAQADRLSSAAANLNGRLYLQQFEQMPSRQPSLLEEAIRCFREAISAGPADYKNYEKLAIAYGWLGKTRDAYDWYLKAAGQYPGCDRLWLELGRLAETLGMTATAVEHYRKAIEIEDGYREQFHAMYPDRKQVVSRLGEMEYRLAQERIAKLAAPDGRPDPLTPRPPQ